MLLVGLPVYNLCQRSCTGPRPARIAFATSLLARCSAGLQARVGPAFSAVALCHGLPRLKVGVLAAILQRAHAVDVEHARLARLAAVDEAVLAQLGKPAGGSSHTPVGSLPVVAVTPVNRPYSGLAEAGPRTGSRFCNLVRGSTIAR